MNKTIYSKLSIAYNICLGTVFCMILIGVKLIVEFTGIDKLSAVYLNAY